MGTAAPPMKATNAAEFQIMYSWELLLSNVNVSSNVVFSKQCIN
jgi:hypothetical protein